MGEGNLSKEIIATLHLSEKFLGNFIWPPLLFLFSSTLKSPPSSDIPIYLNIHKVRCFGTRISVSLSGAIKAYGRCFYLAGAISETLPGLWEKEKKAALWVGTCRARRMGLRENFGGETGEQLRTASWLACFLFPVDKNKLKSNCARWRLQIFQMELGQVLVCCFGRIEKPYPVPSHCLDARFVWHAGVK